MPSPYPGLPSAGGWTLGQVAAGGAGLIGSAISAKMARETAREQMQFQALMSNTAYRRARRDMEAAGLNPILALGQPATTPSGAQASTPDFGESIRGGVSSALAMKMQKEQVKNLAAQRFDTTNAAYLKANMQETEQYKRLEFRERARLARYQSAKVMHEIRSMKPRWRAEQQFWEDVGSGALYWDRGMPAARAAAGLFPRTGSWGKSLFKKWLGGRRPSRGIPGRGELGIPKKLPHKNAPGKGYSYPDWRQY